MKKTLQIKLLFLVFLMVFVNYKTYAQYCTSSSSSKAIYLNSIFFPIAIPPGTPSSNNYIYVFNDTQYSSPIATNYYDGTVNGSIFTLRSDTTNTIGISVYSSGSEAGKTVYYDVWIDYNQNSTFSDAGEKVISGSMTIPSSATSGGNTTTTKVIPFPSSYSGGNTRMRIIIKEGSAPTGPCDTGFTGETEDWTVTLPTPPNSAPVLSNIETTALNFKEGDGATQITNTITASDANNSTLASGTVSITGNFNSGQDVLSFTNTSNTTYGNIAASYNSTTGVLSLTSSGATATVAQWQAALRAVKYNNTSQDPSSSTRTVSFVVNDGTVNSTAVTRQISVTPVNDPPTLSATGSNPTFTEGGSAVTLFSGAAASTVESGQTITSLGLTVSNLTDGANEILGIDGSNVVLTNGTTATTSTNGMSVSVSVSGTTASLTVSNSAGVSTTAMQNIINGLTYKNTNSYALGSRIIKITSITDNGGTANGGSNTTAYSTIASTVSISISTPSTGDGSAGNPYQIANLHDLWWLSSTSSVWGKSFIQTADINASTSKNWDSGAGFTPIGNSTTNFTGTYNGQGHTIDSLYIYRLQQDQAMFGISGAGSVVKNVDLTHVRITSYLYVGSLVGENNGIVSHSYASGSVAWTGRGQILGGLVGLNNSVVEYCTATDTVKTTMAQYVGGLVGQNKGIVTHSHATGPVTGSGNLGGLVGSGGKIVNSYATGSVSGSASNYYGGLAGQADTIINSFATGDVLGTYNVGGLVGTSHYLVDNCYATGSVTGHSAGLSYGGGLIGSVTGGAVRNSYATGAVSPTVNTFGGLIGGYNIVGTVSHCFWDTQTSGQSASPGGGTGKTTAEMKTLTTFTGAGWDFQGETANGTADIWGMNNSVNSGYPFLSWQDSSAYTMVPPVGTGTSTDPYQIANLANLYWLSQSPSVWGSDFVQTADINAAATKNWNSGAGFSPIGHYISSSDSVPFNGTYNGQGHVIDSLAINQNSTPYIGLFGYTGNSSRIENIGLTHANITGYNVVGGLVGRNGGTIHNSYATGSVSSPLNDVGGLVGFNVNAGTVQNSYASGGVSGYNSIGGLVGLNAGIVQNSYATDSVSGKINVGGLVGKNYWSIQYTYATGSVSGSSSVGGLVGYNSNGTVSHSFWDTQTSKQSTSAGGTGKTTAQMKTMTTFTDSTWDFKGETTNGTADTWNINTYRNSGYPFLSWQYPNEPGQTIPQGSGTSADPYQIANLGNLFWLSQNSSVWGSYFIQTADINAAATQNWDSGKGFLPIGNNTTYFSGNYNGKGNIIDSLTINRSTNYVGLFGMSLGSLKIDSLGMEHVNISGGQYVGGIVGLSSSNITNSYATGSVSGTMFVGGLSGRTDQKITNSYSLCNVIGSSYVGGLTGFNDGGTIINCYSTGSVVGGGSYVGGLDGFSYLGSSRYSFWDTQTSGQSSSANGTGKTTAEMQNESTFTAVNWDFTNTWGMIYKLNQGYPYLSWQYSSPTITSFSLASGPVGTIDTIRGTHFNTVDTNNIVRFGATKATVNTATDTSLIVTVPDGADYRYITVTDTTSGFTASSAKPFIVTFTRGGNFAPKVDYATGTSPWGVTTGDFNGDGITDLAVTDYGTDSVSVYLGKNDGTSASRKSYVVGGYNPNGLITGDFNGDGKLDLAVLNGGASGKVTILLGKGDGTFTAKGSYATAGSSFRLITGDFNRDGKLDLAVAGGGSTSGVVSVLLGNGDGTFAAKTDYIVGNTPESVTTGDFNGDGIPDLAVANDASSTVSVLIGNGDGTFAPKVDYTTGKTPVSVTTGDFNGDGKLDLAVANFSSDSVSVFLGKGDGTFAKKVNYKTGSEPVGVTIGDFNGDGKLDLAVANLNSNTVSVLKGNGDGTFAAKVDYKTGKEPENITTGDFNGDGKTDIVVPNLQSNTISILNNIPSPVINSVSPDSAAVGMTVTIAGTNLNAATTVKFGDSLAASYSVVNNDTITAVVGSGASGNVYVTTPAGTDSLAGFTFVVPPSGLSYKTDTISAIYKTAITNDSATVTGIVDSLSIRPVLPSGLNFNTKNGAISGTPTVLSPLTDYKVVAHNIAGTDTTTITIKVNKKTLTVTGATATNKVYDGNTNDTIVGASLLGVVSGDNVSLNDTIGTFAQAKIGNGIAVSTAMTLTGSDAGNYSLTQPSGLSANIMAKTLTVIGTMTSNKVYDGNTNDSISGSALSGVVSGDNVSLANDTIGTFAQATVGNGIAVSTTMTLSGSDAGNYSLTQPLGLSANITKKTLTVSGAVADSKVYDGNTTDTISGASLVGVVGTDNVTLVSPAIGTFAQAAVGNGIPVTAGLMLSGSDTANYALTQPSGLSADIKMAPLTVTADNQSKVYDSTAFTGFTVNYSGFVNGEDMSVLGGSLAFSGSAITATDAGNYVITPGGLTSGNYNITFVNGSLTIQKADQTISFGSLPQKHEGEPSFGISASSTSGLPVTFSSSDNAIASVSDTTVTIVAGGTCTIFADQPGNNNYNPAPEVGQPLVIISLGYSKNYKYLFSPNGDGINDHWKIPNISEMGHVQVKVYDRWGSIVYQSSDYHNNWNGTYRGKQLPVGVYICVIRSSKLGVQTGVINLIR